MKTALWKGGMTIVCTAVSVSSLIGVKSDIPIVVNKISTGIFGMGNSLTTTEKSYAESKKVKINK